MAGVHARGPRCGVLGCPREGASLWRVWVSTRGGLVMADCETHWLRSGVHKLGSGTCSHVASVPCSGTIGPCTQCGHVQGSCGAETGNDAGLGLPGATAHQEVVIPSASGEVLAAARSRSRTPRRKPLRCFAAREIKEKVSGLAVRVVEKSCTSLVKSTSVPSRNADWEFPPARLGAPGRKAIGVARYNLSNNYIARTMWRRRKQTTRGQVCQVIGGVCPVTFVVVDGKGR